MVGRTLYFLLLVPPKICRRSQQKAFRPKSLRRSGNGRGHIARYRKQADIDVHRASEVTRVRRLVLLTSFRIRVYGGGAR